MVLFLAANVGVYFFYRAKRAREHLQAEDLLVTVEARLHAAKPSELADAESELTRVFQLESRSQRAALDWTRERAMRGLVKNGADVAFEDAMARAKEVGVPEEKYAFARVASFLFQGDTAGAAAVLPRWEAAAGEDAWYQMVAGATLERAGDARARERYARAYKLDPELFAAKEALARSTAMDGDVQEAMRLSKAMRAAMPERAEPVALVALSWGRDAQREDIRAPSEVAEVGKRKDELPSGLKFVPHAIAALGALDLAEGALSGKLRLDASKLNAVAGDDAPWADLLAMDVSLDEGDLASADKIALRWGKDAESRPLRALRLARLARYEGRLDAADAFSQTALAHAAVTPRVLEERVFMLVARGRSTDVPPLLARYPLVLGPLATWLSAYASASGGNVEVAKGRTASIDPPPPGAPLHARIVAAAALGAMKDRRRGGDYVRELLVGGRLHPDLVAAALALGFHKIDRGRRTPIYQ
jgi:hypothetical protein